MKWGWNKTIPFYIQNKTITRIQRLLQFLDSALQLIPRNSSQGEEITKAATILFCLSEMARMFLLYFSCYKRFWNVVRNVTNMENYLLLLMRGLSQIFCKIC